VGPEFVLVEIILWTLNYGLSICRSQGFFRWKMTVSVSVEDSGSASSAPADAVDSTGCRSGQQSRSVSALLSCTRLVELQTVSNRDTALAC